MLTRINILNYVLSVALLEVSRLRVFASLRFVEVVARCTAALGHGFSAHDSSMAATSGHFVAVTPGIGASFIHNGATGGVLLVVVLGHGRLNGVVNVGSSVQSGSDGVALS